MTPSQASPLEGGRRSHKKKTSPSLRPGSDDFKEGEHPSGCVAIFFFFYYKKKLASSQAISPKPRKLYPQPSLRTFFIKKKESEGSLIPPSYPFPRWPVGEGVRIKEGKNSTLRLCRPPGGGVSRAPGSAPSPASPAFFFIPPLIPGDKAASLSVESDAPSLSERERALAGRDKKGSKGRGAASPILSQRASLPSDPEEGRRLLNFFFIIIKKKITQRDKP